MPKHDSTKVKQLAHARGFEVRQERGRFILTGPADYGPCSYEEARAFLSAFPTERKRRALAQREAEELTQGQIDVRRRRKGYDAPIYEPELHETAPPELMGLHEIIVGLPVGAESDDALRNLWVAENRERKRGAEAVRKKLGEARGAIAAGGLEPHCVIASDHDLASARAYGEPLPVVLLAAYLMPGRFVRAPGAHGTRNKKLPGLWRATA